jgi:kinesin family protein 4/21/27
MRLQDVLKEREQEIAHLEISLKEKEAFIPLPSSLPETTGPHTVDKIESPSVFLSPRTINQFDEIKTVLQQGPGPGGADVMSNPEPESDEPLDRLNELMRYVITSLLSDYNSPRFQRNGSEGISAPRDRRGS